ncbi:MAG: hypothetical protein QM704_00800 [Anaeromyxobacteraceae bacterium]
MRIPAALGAAAALALAACGDGNNNDKKNQLDTAMSGTWAGTATLTIEGVATPTSFPGELDVAVSGDQATVSKLCLDAAASGSVVAKGDGSAASWNGTQACPAIDFEDCTGVVMTFKTVNLALAGTTLTATGTGTAEGCSLTKGFTITLTGTKAGNPQ